MMKSGSGHNKLKHIIRVSIALAKAKFWMKGAGSFLGVLWYIIDPLVMFVLFMFVRSVVGEGIPHYPIYLFIGLMMFNFFRKTTSEATKAIRSNGNLIKSIRTKQESFVVAGIMSALFAHLFELALLLGLLLFFEIPALQLLGYIPILVLLTAFTLGVSFITATIGTYINDFANFWGFLTRILWFATPLFYSANLALPFNVNQYNPMYYFITLAREIVISGAVDWQLLAWAVIFGLGSLFIGALMFKYAKKRFADMI